MRRKVKLGPLPVTQRASRRWAVQWRRGNAYRDTYEVLYRGHFEGGVAVTGEGWKWFRPTRGWRIHFEYSDKTFATWEEAVADLAGRFRRTRRGREIGDVQVPDAWINTVLPRSPWTPRPIHPDFETYFAARQEASSR